MDERSTECQKEYDMEKSGIHRMFKKKPSRETLGSNLALSVLKEGNLI